MRGLTLTPSFQFLCIFGRRVPRYPYTTNAKHGRNSFSFATVILRRSFSYLLMRVLHSHIPRAQELEGEAALLGEQLKIAEAKFRETDKALRR